MNPAPAQSLPIAAAAHASRFLIPFVCLALGGFTAQVARAAAPLAGTTIGNAASATYKDASGTDRAATSNTVTTVVQQVASFTIVANRTATVSPGGQVFFPHIVTNTGNGNETYTIGAANATGDNFDLTGLTVYADADKNGIPDNTTPITTTGILASGASFGFVVVGSAPGSATAAQTANVTVSAVGSIATTPQTNTDITTITSNAVIAVTKAVSANSGAPGSGPYTYTLTYTNTGNGAGTALTITDIVPTGFTYLANSGRWSVTGSTVLTDASAADDQSGIVYDYNVTVTGRVTAVIASVSPGQSGTFSFQFNVNTPLAAQTINNTANYSYDPDGAGPTAATTPVPTNTVPFTVAGTSGVQLGADLTNDTITTVASALPGATVAFTANLVTNLGNGTDTFNLSFDTNTFPTGTTFAFFKSDGNTPLVDTNGDGIPDTGPLAAAATYNVTVKATLPNVISGGSAPYTINLKATSVNDPTKSDLDNDKLTTAAALTVDLTNDAPASDAGTQLGEGTGPEVNPVKTNSTNPGTTTRFTLFAYNPNTVADSYGLTASTDSTFATLTLPTGWSVVFRDTSEAIITSTGVVLAGGNKQFYADVTVPAGYAPGNIETYFRVLSPTTAAGDRIHDRVTVNTVRELSLTPNNTGQTYPGGSVVYEHTLKNNGNVLEGNGTASTVALALANTLTGWTSITYFDSNNNGSLDATDAVVTDLSFTSNGTAGLDPGESVRLFTKVFAPPGAPNLAINGTTFTATTSNGTYTATVPALATATDTTSVVTGDLTLLKEQVLNANCDGTPTGYAQTQITTGATPGACVKYRITVRNVGSKTATNIKIFDATPAFTTYLATPAAVATGGTVNTTIAPTTGTAGNFEFNIGDLASGASATATFTVKINN
jgi:uncharacterized repeat protein (TIGR01451 family)